jgi:hypothetical protein
MIASEIKKTEEKKPVLTLRCEDAENQNAPEKEEFSSEGRQICDRIAGLKTNYVSPISFRYESNTDHYEAQSYRCRQILQNG